MKLKLYKKFLVLKEMITKRDNKKIRENWRRINKLIK